IEYPYVCGTLCSALHRDTPAIRRKRGSQLVVLVDRANCADAPPGAVYPYELPSRGGCRPMSDHASRGDGEGAPPDPRIRGHRLSDLDRVTYRAIPQVDAPRDEDSLIHQQQVPRGRIRGSSFCRHEPRRRAAVEGRDVYT